MVAQLFVKSLTGKTILLNVDPSTSVEAVKQMLYESQGIPVADQRLLVGGKQLEDGLTLADYNIMSDSSVDVMLRLLGGAGSIVISTVTTTTTAIVITLSNFGTSGIQADNWTITVTDNGQSWSYTNFAGWGQALNVASTFNWTNFTSLSPTTSPYPGDGFTVAVQNVTRTQSSNTFTTANFTGTPNAPATLATPTSSASTFFVTVVVPATQRNITAISVQVYDSTGVTLRGTQTDNAGSNTGSGSWPLVASTSYAMQITTASLGYTLVSGTSYTFKAAITNAGGTSSYTAITSAVTFVGVAPCFLPTSRLLTPEGYKCAKDVKTGDLLVTSDGRKVPVQRYVYKLDKAGDAEAPYVIAKGAFKPNYPAEDMLLSPGHAVEVRPGFWQLPKNMSAEKAQQYGVGKPVTYYHFEAPNYLKDNFICSGAIVESYAGHQLYYSNNIFTYNEKEKGHTRSLEHNSTHRKAL